MAGFCVKCGAKIESDALLCSNCERYQAQILNQVNYASKTGAFCSYCGSVVDNRTGNCSNPNCSMGGAMKKSVEAKPKKSALKALFEAKPTKKTKVFSTILCICLVLTSFLAITICSIRNTMKEENLEKLFNNIEATEAIDDIGKIVYCDLDDFYDFIWYEYDLIISDKELNEIVDETNIKGFIAEKLSDFCDDFFAGEGELMLENSEVFDLLDRNQRKIEKELDVELDYETKFQLANYVVYDVAYVVADVDSIKENSPGAYTSLTIGLSYVTMIILFLLSGLIIFFMFKNNVPKAMLNIGIYFSALGGLTGLIALLAAWITPLWKAICSNSLIGMLLGNFMSVNVGVSIILLVVGIGLLITRSVMVKKYSKKAA